LPSASQPNSPSKLEQPAFSPSKSMASAVLVGPFGTCTSDPPPDQLKHQSYLQARENQS
jgi:hypothetical protein